MGNLLWDIVKVRKQLDNAFSCNSERKLSKVLKENAFLFYSLYSRQGNVRPTFSEISFGDNLRCDYAWLNDSSDGPEWILMELKEPKLMLFKTTGKPTAKLLQAIEQVNSWKRYFDNNPHEKKRIFGAVSRFRYVLVTGLRINWHTENAAKWRSNHNKNNGIEIRTSNVFYDAIDIAVNRPKLIEEFTEHRTCLGHSELEGFWTNYSYMDNWRKIL